MFKYINIFQEKENMQKHNKIISKLLNLFFTDHPREISFGLCNTLIKVDKQSK